MMRRLAILALGLALLVAALPAWAGGDPLAGPHAPLPGPQWKLYESRGVSLVVPARWYGFFYVGFRPLYGWWALKRHALYTEMEFSLFEMEGPPQLGKQGQVSTQALGPSRLAGMPASVFLQIELAGTPDARQRLILVLDRALPDGSYLWAVADSDAKKWDQTEAYRQAILASLRIEPFFFVLGSSWRLNEKGGVYLDLPWDWEGRALEGGHEWSGPAGSGRSLSLGWRKGSAPDLAGWNRAGTSRIGKYPCTVYDRRSEKNGATACSRLALVDQPLKDGQRIWLLGELRGAKGENDWRELLPALNAMLRATRLDWVLF